MAPRRRSRACRPSCGRRSRCRTGWNWMPGSRASMSCTVWPGERSISCAVMTVDEAPVMIVPVTMPDGPAVSAGASASRRRHPGATLRRAPLRPAHQAGVGHMDAGRTVWLVRLRLRRRRSTFTQRRRRQAPTPRKSPRCVLRCPIARVLRCAPRGVGDRDRNEAHERSHGRSASANAEIRPSGRYAVCFGS